MIGRAWDAQPQTRPGAVDMTPPGRVFLLSNTQAGRTPTRRTPLTGTYDHFDRRADAGHRRDEPSRTRHHRRRPKADQVELTEEGKGTRSC